MGHRLFRQGREVCGGGVLLNLFRSSGSRDGAGDLRKHQDPAQCELGQGHIRGTEFPKLIDRSESELEINPGEGLTPVEGSAIAIERPVIVGGEDAVRGQLPGEQTRGQGHPGQDADLPSAGLLGA